MVQKEEKEATAKAEKTQAIADDAQRDLDEALPMLVSYPCMGFHAQAHAHSYMYIVCTCTCTHTHTYTHTTWYYM